MYAQCSECLTIYKVRAEALVHGRGRARCGTCGAEFDVFATLTDELPPEPFNTLKRRVAPAGVPQLTVPAARPQSEQRELFVQFDPSLRAEHKEAPAFVRKARTVAVRAPVSWGWRFATLAMALLLTVQLAWVYRQTLLGNARLHALAEKSCENLGCTLPALADRSRMRLMARDIAPHPSVPHALIISATVANEAPFAQTYPVIEITLSDVNERRIAMRRFRPEEYLGDPRNIAIGLAAGATVTLSLEVEDPGRDAVAFEFQFL
jgi:predicted Zn finger-like uncharacterized protein